MNRFSIRLLVISILLVCLSGAVWFGIQKQSMRLDKKRTNIATRVANPTEYKKFVIVISSYNNTEYAKDNMISVLSQIYGNYRVIFTDDASTDDTFDIVSRVVQSHPAGEKVTMIRNSQNRGAMANVYNAVHCCSNDEIIVILDGDDQLNGSHVLKTLNAYYNNSDVWITYGQSIESTTKKVGTLSKPISQFVLKSGRIKSQPWMTSHLRTFYAGLFKRIKTEDLCYEGAFVPMSGDLAAMFPMIEMSREHTFYLPDPLYLYNLDNSFNEHKNDVQQQHRVEAHLRKLPAYPPLAISPWESDDFPKECDVIAFSEDRPLQLYAFLESLEHYVRGVKDLFVLYKASDEAFENGYAIVKEEYPYVTFLRYSNHKELKSKLMKHAFKEKGHLVFASDDLVIKDEIHFEKGIDVLERSQVGALFYGNGRHIDLSQEDGHYLGVPHLIPVGNDFFIWQFSNGKGMWGASHSASFAMYRKDKIKSEIKEMSFGSVQELIENWSKKSNIHQFGLCHSEAKVACFPFDFRNSDFPNEMMLSVFMKGKKVDLKPLYEISNRSTHTTVHPTFVVRD